MALDQSRLDLENKSVRIFYFRQVDFTKTCQQIWVCVFIRKQNEMTVTCHHVLVGWVCSSLDSAIGFSRVL